MLRMVCAVDQSLYYQLLCKGLLLLLLRYQSIPWKLTVLLDGNHSRPLDDLRDRVDFVAVEPLDIICGCVPSRTTFARLEIPYIFPDDERVLYLDVDTFAMHDLSELLTIPFDTLAAVIPGQNLMIKELVHREFKSTLNTMTYELDGTTYSCGTEDHRYFNAGVMLIDPYKWRVLRIRQHVEALTRAHSSAMHTSDEMALNLIFRGRFTELRACYNTFTFTEKYLPELPRFWHFNTYKPILHAPLSQFQTWLSLFRTKDQMLLKKLERTAERQGKAALLAMKSDEYDQT